MPTSLKNIMMCEVDMLLLRRSRALSMQRSVEIRPSYLDLLLRAFSTKQLLDGKVFKNLSKKHVVIMHKRPSISYLKPCALMHFCSFVFLNNITILASAHDRPLLYKRIHGNHKLRKDGEFTPPSCRRRFICHWQLDSSLERAFRDQAPDPSRSCAVPAPAASA